MLQPLPHFRFLTPLLFLLALRLLLSTNEYITFVNDNIY